jgi:beta-fructofuranosidase
MLWTPTGLHVGDPTIVRVGDEYHLFAECSPSDWQGGMGKSFAGIRVVNHAVSRDMIEWKELPNALACGPPGSFDAYSIYHLDVFVHEGRWHMFYTGLDKGGPGEQQSIGLATSEDGIAWKKHPSNPVLRADPRWYEPAIPREATYQEKDFGRLWFRDPCVVRLPDGKFGMIVAARDRRVPPDVRACLAWAVSDDLVHWEPRPPIYSPGRFHTIETPSIFERGGRWYVQFMTHPLWGVPPLMTDPHQDAGDYIAISDRGPEGPYRQPPDEVLVAAHRDVRMGASRTVDGPDGERWFYGWLRLADPGSPEAAESGAWQVIPPARPVRFQPDGTMRVHFNAGIERFFRPAPLPAAPAFDLPGAWRPGPPLAGKRFRGATRAVFDGARDHGIFSATVEFAHGARAGLVLRHDLASGRGVQAVADRRMGRIEFGVAGAPTFLDARRWAPADRVNLKVVAWKGSLEVYADDRLMIHQSCPIGFSGGVGFVVDDAEAAFREARFLEARMEG